MPYGRSVAGAAGYLTKESDSDLLLPAIRRVASGGIFLSHNVAELLAQDISRTVDAPLHKLLSNREYEIFTRIINGESMTKIAADLSLSIKTVSTHKSHILEKMNLSGQVNLVRYAIEHHLLELSRG